MPCARSHARSPPPPCHSPRATAPPAARRRRAAPLCPTPPLAARCSAPPHRLVSQHRSPPHRSLRRSLRHSLRCSLRRSAHCTARRAPLVALLVSICKGSEGTHRMISIQVTLSNAWEEAQLWGIAIGRMAGAHLTLVN